MARIKPFRGVRYNLELVGQIGRVVAPPYDVIDSRMQQVLYDAHPKNIVRIIQGKNQINGVDPKGRYSLAAKHYKDWLYEGTLQRDSQEGFYIYAQDFNMKTPVGFLSKSRLGIVGLVQIDALGEGLVLPHEHTMPGPKADRLELMRSTGAAFGQIFSIYSDPEFKTRSLLKPHLAEAPLFCFKDQDSVVHRLWQVTDQKTLQGVIQILSEKTLFIADGHHRYETAINYKEEQSLVERITSINRPYSHSMMTLVNMDDEEGMTINPIHRVVMGLGAFGRDRLEAGIQNMFEIEVEVFTSIERVLQEIHKRARGGRTVFGYCTGENLKIKYLTLKKSVDLANLDMEGHSETWRKLDTGILQLTLGRILDLNLEALTGGEKVRFVKGESEFCKLLGEAPDRAGFLLNPIDLVRLREVVLAGDRMPPKSTFFYPKVYSGLVIQDLSGF